MFPKESTAVEKEEEVTVVEGRSHKAGASRPRPDSPEKQIHKNS